jgi:hypothetical protein
MLPRSETVSANSPKLKKQKAMDRTTNFIFQKGLDFKNKLLPELLC